MTLEVVYPYNRASLEPRPMNARQIWSVADQVRRQLVPRRPIACIDLERLIRAAGSMVVNGIAIATHWDLDRSVRDGHGRDALGVTEADPALPGVVLISLKASARCRSARSLHYLPSIWLCCSWRPARR